MARWVRVLNYEGSKITILIYKKKHPAIIMAVLLYDSETMKWGKPHIYCEVIAEHIEHWTGKILLDDRNDNQS